MTVRLKRHIVQRHPIRIERLPLLGMLHRAAFRPRRRAAKRIFGRPVRGLYRLARAAGLAGRGILMLEVGDTEHPLLFDARNTQFLAPADQMAYEPELAALLDILVPDSGVFFDIGANWGYLSLYVLSRPGFTGVVHAFEPYPPTFSDLESIRRQCPFGERLVCHAMALSDRNETTQMGLVDGFQSGLARMDGNVGVFEVEARRLDSLGLPLPDLIKIDVEGHEARVLLGARESILAARPAIVFESWREAQHPRITLEPFDVLAEVGYRFYVPTWVHESEGHDVAVTATNRTPGPSAQLGLVEIESQHRFLLADQINVLAYPSERFSELTERFGEVTR